MNIEIIDEAIDLYIEAAKKKKRKITEEAAKGMMSRKKHPWQNCVKKMKDNVKKPQAFCAKMKDKYKGTTKWRGKE